MTTTGSDRGVRELREEAFWDDHTPSLEQCLQEWEAGPDPNTRALLDALEPLAGATVLDVGCGTGILSARLAQRGARVTGIDISPASIERAAELTRRLGFDAQFVCGGFPSIALGGQVFDRLAGRYVLHHLDPETCGPAIARTLAPTGTAAFVETMATNPVLRLSRRLLVGRLGIPRYGTEDERPLGRAELAMLARDVGKLEIVVAQLSFFRIFDRQIFKFRWRVLSRVFGMIDDGLLDLGLTGASYHQVLVLKTAREGP